MKKKYLFIVLFALVFIPFMDVNAAYTTVSCGNVTGIPEKIPSITRLIMTLIQIAIPVVLAVAGSIDLLKGLTAQKEDEIKKGQQMFIKRLITAALVFFVIAIVKVVISLVADNSNESENIINCVDCFLSDKRSCTIESQTNNLETNINSQERLTK
jgi:hypothetical protein